jgi:hypothetical protein
MRVVDFNRLFGSPAPEVERVWLASTYDRSANWGFDRFRLFNVDSAQVMVSIFRSEDITGTYARPDGRIVVLGTPYAEKPFSSTSNFEHDFFFDLSGTTGQLYFCINIVEAPGVVKQIYTYPTGYSATTGRNAKVSDWDFSLFDLSGNDTYARFENQPLSEIFFRDTTRTPVINAKFAYFQNTALTSTHLDNLIIWINNANLSSGTLKYENTGSDPTNASKTAYDDLINRGWTITGNAPPII